MSTFTPSALRKLGAASFITIFVLLQLSVFILPALGSSTSKSEAAGPFTANTTDVFPELSFDRPSVITNAGDERLFIAEEGGKIWSVRGSGSAAAKTLFLDIEASVKDGCERGLLGLAFHPDYGNNGYFYVNYITDNDGMDLTRVSRFQVTADPDAASAASELILMEIDQPYCNHNGGAVQFDSQGMLVTGLGDGGSGGDPHNNSQNPQSYLGKLLRIDVDKKEGGKNYAIPEDNPFVGQEPLDEIWALGLRNPWRFSFDRFSGDLYIGDVGQNRWEEIDYVPAAKTGGQNFEWSIKEGDADFKPDQDIGPGMLTGPVHVYEHKEHAQCYSIVGGHVYRGPQSPLYHGMYVYADYCSGKIYGLFRDRHGKWQNRPLARGEVTMTTFGEDSPGELYFSVRSSGKIFRLELGKAQSQSLLPLIIR